MSFCNLFYELDIDTHGFAVFIFHHPEECYKGIQYNLCMHSPVDGYLGYSQFLVPVNNAATNNIVKCPSDIRG